jgi:hypothetical protein
VTDRPAPTEHAVRVDLGPVARKQLEGVLGQTAGGLLATIVEALGHDPAAGWSLTIERAHLDHTPAPATNGTPRPPLDTPSPYAEG